MRLLDNLYQVGGPSLTHNFDATTYLIKGVEECILIDCGTVEGYEELKENIRKCNTEPSCITKILGTHGHYDHVGAAALWKEEFGTKLFLHEADREQVETGNSVRTTASLLYGTEFLPAVVDGLLKESDRFIVDGTQIEVMYTPGHTMGGVCFDISIGLMKILIAGDTIWGGFSEKIGSNEEAWKESLKKITGRHFDSFTFGHVNPQLIGDADVRLKEAQMAFANYYNPWFKTFKDTYRY